MTPATPPDLPELDDSPHALTTLLGAAPPTARPRPATTRAGQARSSQCLATPAPPVGRAPEGPTVLSPASPRPAELHEPPSTASAPAPSALCEPLLFTPEQAALLLQVPASWLRKQAAVGRISSVLLGRHLLFARTDLDALVEDTRRPATESRRFRSGR